MEISVREIRGSNKTITPCIVCKEKFEIGEYTLVIRTSGGHTSRYCLFHGLKWIKEELKKFNAVNTEMKTRIQIQKALEEKENV